MVMSYIFWSRGAIYLLLMAVPAFLPGISLYWEGSFILRSLVIVPAGMLLGWFGPRLGKRRGVSISHMIIIAMPLLFLPWTGFSRTLLDFALTGWYAYFSTWLIFQKRMGRLLYPEPFYYAWILYRLMGFSRVSEEAAAAARGFNSVMFVLMIAGFALYALLIYRFEYSSRKSRPDLRESIISAALFIGTALSLVLFIPPDFVSRLQVLNNLDNILEPELRTFDSDRDSPGNRGNLVGDGNPTDQSGEGDELGQLLMMNAERWGREPRPGDGQGGAMRNQYMVMVVSSPREPVYLADEYYNLMDPVRGFYSDPDFELNRLIRSQFLESWVNPDPLPLRNRVPVWIDVYSTIPDKVSSFQPFNLEPTVYDRRWHPLSYTYRTRSLISNISMGGQFPRLGRLTSEEQEQMAPYLEVGLTEDYRRQYQDFLDGIIDDGDGFMERIVAILRNFSSFQYELGFTDNVSIQAISAFLFENRTGDCTEFSNSAAILARMAGIPSRVVTGYLVSRDLQSPNHVMALDEIRNRYPPLEGEDPDDLFLVTTAHRHSWPQFYLPVYGWVDFEATAFAIPPAGDMNPNNLNVVIPDIRERTVVQQQIEIPWGLIIRIALSAALLSLAALYVLRWERIIRLGIVSKKNTEKGYKALYRLLLIRLYARGYELKEPDATVRDYASSYPELAAFASLYEKLVFGSKPDKPGDGSIGTDPLNIEEFRQLREEYRRIIRMRRGPGILLKQAFGIKDLRYL